MVAGTMATQCDPYEQIIHIDRAERTVFQLLYAVLLIL